MADWATRTFKANGIDVHYHRTGGDKPPVILLHGLMLSGACWTPLARALEKNYAQDVYYCRYIGKYFLDMHSNAFLPISYVLKFAQGSILVAIHSQRIRLIQHVREK